MMTKESLKQRTAKGLFWSAMNSGTTQVLNLVIGIFLGRLLTSADYGVVGVLTIFTAIAGDLQSSGFTQSLVNLPAPARRDYSAVFTFNVVVSVIIYTILFFSAPLIAAFFRQDCLVDVSRFVFLGFLISSFSISHGGYLIKNMMNREMAIIGTAALVISGVTGITLALLGQTYWSLAWQQIVYILVITVGRYIAVPMRMRLTRDMRPVRQMAPFALRILVTKIVNTLSSNILTFIFGRLYPISQVGHYSQAYKWSTMGHSVVTNTVGQVAQAVMVEAGSAQPGDTAHDTADDTAHDTAHDNAHDTAPSDQARQLRVFRKMVRFTCFLSMPLMCGLSLVGHEFIILTIGPAWSACVPLLQVLCLSGAFFPLYTMYQNLAISRGRSDLYMWLCLVQIAVQLLLVVLCRSHGMLFMVSAYSAFMILWLLPWHHLAGRLIGYGWRQMLSDVLPFVLATLFTMAGTWLITRMIASPVLLLVSRVVIASAIYYIVMRVCRCDILAECQAFLMKKIRKNV